MSATPALFATTTQVVAGPHARDDADLIGECVNLFNRHYGVWGPRGHRPGEPVVITRTHLRSLLESKESSLSTVRVEDELAGYSVVVRFHIPDRGRVHWVSQLVVAEQYRKMRFATDLLFSAWNFTDAWAWGLATVNPYAVRALETTTRRHCKRRYILENGPDLCAELARVVSYIPPGLARDPDGRPIPAVDTQFFIDHSDIQKMKERVSRAERPWDLGKSLPEGHEWMAAVFREQEPSEYDADRLEHLLTASDVTWIDAYSRMTLDDDHLWMQHTASEVEFLRTLLGGGSGSTAIDVGCGVGRHAIALRELGVDHVIGYDIVPELIEKALDQPHPTGVEFALADLRTFRGEAQADLVYALYDVVGSSAKVGDDLLLLQGMKSLLKQGGSLVLSVMNAEPTMEDPRLRRVHNDQDLVIELENLPASNNMEATGSVFDPTYCLEYNGTFFRKEEFVAPGEHLPVELVVRDRRYTVAMITEIVERSGFRVESAVPVQAGRWNREPALPPDDPRAKEILVVARLAN